jgi:hypothetical protein
MLEFLTRQSLSLILFSYAIIVILLAEQLSVVLILFVFFVPYTVLLYLLVEYLHLTN